MRRPPAQLPLSILLGLAACGGRSSLPDVPPDRAPLCADVADVRVCWGCEGGGDCLVERFAPAPAPPLGWRCTGGGKERRCLDRAPAGGPFLCTKTECRQVHPRMPDDGEWECIDMGGAVMCHGGEPPAAVVEGPADPGWICGPRAQGPRGPEKVCVDFSPDRPGGDIDGWSCTYDHEHGEKRLCRRDPSPKRLGARCEVGCPDGAACVEGRCAPARPSPSCWFDTDCEGGRPCRFGTCS